VRLIVLWDTLDHGIMPLSGSWLTMAELVQLIILPRALAGQHPQNADEIIDGLEQTVAGWNADPTAVGWLRCCCAHVQFLCQVTHQGPNRSGWSCHDEPVYATRRMPSTIRR
jgi:hypothetical protein